MATHMYTRWDCFLQVEVVHMLITRFMTQGCVMLLYVHVVYSDLMPLHM